MIFSIFFNTLLIKVSIDGLVQQYTHKKISDIYWHLVKRSRICLILKVSTPVVLLNVNKMNVYVTEGIKIDDLGTFIKERKSGFVVK